jgi:hypothetical protein
MSPVAGVCNSPVSSANDCRIFDMGRSLLLVSFRRCVDRSLNGCSIPTDHAARTKSDSVRIAPKAGWLQLAPARHCVEQRFASRVIRHAEQGDSPCSAALARIRASGQSRASQNAKIRAPPRIHRSMSAAICEPLRHPPLFGGQ